MFVGQQSCKCVLQMALTGSGFLCMPDSKDTCTACTHDDDYCVSGCLLTISVWTNGSRYLPISRRSKVALKQQEEGERSDAP